MDQEPDQPADGAADSGPVRTGVARVDEVLAAVEELEERPIEEHVGVFETAHGELRRALDGDPRAGTPSAPASTSSTTDPA
ncbi:hypothetical protein [Nocardioides abyssi]|uniref:Uncharacterized protein n=1 Tax=Nocardioides abyssi TaxID=3058370 RepID=A0ABT8EUY8_9ACTN|nr:hypothetical protein [Nocardioides abyssi]MDN4161853.1 hypothetical protein [Nocardioides abyssi]